ncbi:MAG TPA: methyltransferase domain-containing protein [Anaeromyxobacter sp.]|nr:methyltransferase domain-containing protein [Anaeromyxobacter sp.]
MTDPPQNPLSGPRLWDRVAPGYLRDVAPGLALFCGEALRLARVGEGSRVADVACGPGSLSLAAARLGARASALDFSAEMVELLRQRAAAEGVSCVEAQVGDGMALPWPDGEFDAAISLFGLIFFSDRARGLAELHRILRPGGRAVISSWVPAARQPVMADVWTVLGSELPDLPYSRVRPVLAEPGELRAAIGAAGFRGVEVREVIQHLEVASAVEHWRTLERSAPPLLAARETVPPERWAALSSRIAERIESRFGTESIQVPLIALLGVGIR